MCHSYNILSTTWHFPLFFTLREEGIRVNINKFSYVLAIAEYQNMTKAAEALYISQPALTKSLNLLEAELGVKLFDRNISPIRLTYAGEVFLQKAQKIMEMHDHMMKEMSSIATLHKSRLILGIPGERGTMWLPLILPTFFKQFPDVDLQIIEGNSAEIEDKLLNNEIDLAFYTLPIYASKIEFEVIADDPFVIAAAKTHPFCQRFNLSQNDYCHPYQIPPELLINEEFTSIRSGAGVRRVAEYIFERYGIPYNIIYEFSRHETAVQIAGEGVGLTVTPIMTIIRTGLKDKMAYFSLDNPPAGRKVIFAHSRTKGLSLAGKAFINVTKEIIKTPAAKTVISPELTVIPALYV